MPPQARATGQPVNVVMPRDLHDALADRAASTGESQSTIIRAALRYYLVSVPPVPALPPRG